MARGRVRVARERQDGTADNQDVRVLDAGETRSTAPTTVAPVPETRDAPPARGHNRRPRAMRARARCWHARRPSAQQTIRRPRGGPSPADACAFSTATIPARDCFRTRSTATRPAQRSRRGAAEAFKDAIAVAPDAPFREDAQARLVEAYEASHDHSRCPRSPGGVFFALSAGHSSRQDRRALLREKAELPDRYVCSCCSCTRPCTGPRGPRSVRRAARAAGRGFD